MSQINITNLIDRGRLSRFQILVLVSCGVCMALDGFDVQAMAYIAPALIKDWRLDKLALAPIFSGGLLGIMVGSMAFSVAADRIGRRPVLIGGMLFLSLTTFATAKATSPDAMAILRFISGVAMGAVFPNALALAGEYSPARVKGMCVMMVSCGFVFGGAIGGFIAAALIPSFGWQSVFYVGAIAPLLMVVVLIFTLPESLQFLAANGKDTARMKLTLHRVAPELQLPSDASILISEHSPAGLPVVSLFRDGFFLGTVLLWIANFMNLLCLYFLSNWLPVIMNEAGHTPSQAVIAGAVFWLGGVLSNVLLGCTVDRVGFGRMLSFIFPAAVMAIAAIGQVPGSLLLVLVVSGIAGFCVLGGQSGLNALSPTYYPVAVRSTGTGWASGIGRFGSIFGPLLGGELMRLHWSTAEFFQAATIPALVASASMVLFWRYVKLARVDREPRGVTQEILPST